MTLDVDKNAFAKKLRIVPEESQDHGIPWLQGDVTNQFAKPSKRIEPLPGVCIKTFTENGEKIFVNVCHSKEMLPPEDISDEQFYRLMRDDEVPYFVIPMAIGLEKMAKDKNDIERSTFDILINTLYFEKCLKKPHFLKFTITAILESINDKYNKTINVLKYIKLQNLKVMGSLDVFNIEDRQPKKPDLKNKPFIQVLDDIEDDKPKIVEMKEQNVKPIESSIILETEDGEKLIAFFYLPSSNIKDLTLDIGETRIIVENQKTGTVINQYLPLTIDNENVVANYDSQFHILRLTMPLKGH